MDEQEQVSNSGSSRTLTTRHTEINSGVRVLNLLDEKQLAQAELFLKKIIGAERCGLKTVQDGLSVLMRAQDLKLPFSTCIEHIHVINGKTGVDIHIVKSLLSRAGIVWECTKDYIPQYQYTDGNSIYNETQLPSYCVKCRTADEAAKATNNDVVGVYPVKWYTDLKNNLYNEFQVSNKCVIAINRKQAEKIASEGNFPIIRVAAQPIDYVTEYKFTRHFTINGKDTVQEAVSHFSYSEAVTAEMFKKDTYVHYARIMIGHRAFMLGARDIASDVIMGCMETKELKIVEGKPLEDADFVEIE